MITPLKYELDPKCYIDSPSAKTHIVLHGSLTRTKYTFTGEDNVESCLMKKWNIMSDKYAGHYVVGRQGTVWSCVDEDFWTNHLFAGKKLFDYNRKSIAVFLTNELYLERENNQFYAFGIKKNYNIYKGPIIECKAKGYEYWADHEELQINALINLLKDITTRHQIPATMIGETMRHNPYAWHEAGIISAANANQDSFSLPFAPWAKEKIQKAGIRLI